MLSIRIVWGGTVRFCMLPLRVTHASLLRQVAARFGVAEAARMQLFWAEASDSYALDSQAAWEECLQRRGLAERPGRLELLVKGAPPGRRPLPRRALAAEAAGAGEREAAPETPTGPGFLVTGTQALPPGVRQTPTFALEIAAEGLQVQGGRGAAPRRNPPLLRRVASSGGYRRDAAAAAAERSAGKAWAVATGRDQRIHWAPEKGVLAGVAKEGRGPRPSPSGAELGLCLEGRRAA